MIHHDDAFHEFVDSLFDGKVTPSCENVHPISVDVLNDVVNAVSNDDYTKDELQEQIVACLSTSMTVIEAVMWEDQMVVGETEDEIDEDDPEFWLTLEDIEEIIYRSILFALLSYPRIKAQWEAVNGKE